MSPAQAFLASLTARSDVGGDVKIAESRPDDEGQSIGVNGEYVIGRTISRGGFGVVKEVHALNKGRSIVRAVKIVHKMVPGLDDAANDEVQQRVEHEVSIWRHLRHRHILGLHAVYDTEFATFCVMDLNVGGTLYDLVRRSRQDASSRHGRRGLDPHIARNYAFQLACAVRYLHEDIRVCHRDIKLENCLIDMTVPDADINGGLLRLCDFGLADFLHSGGSVDDPNSDDPFCEQLSVSTELLTASSVIGTLEYASPRGLSSHRKLFDTTGDIWAYGVVVYALCTGDLPFRHPLPSKVADLILRGEWDEVALRLAACGPDAVDLVHGCLEKDDDLRLNISDVLRCHWFHGCEEVQEEVPSSVWH